LFDGTYTHILVSTTQREMVYTNVKKNWTLVQPEDGSSCTSRNMLLEDIIFDLKFISLNSLTESCVRPYSRHFIPL
jgi:hypothetical protein